MKRSVTLVVFVFLTACAIAILPAAGPNYASAKKPVAADAGLIGVAPPDFSAEDLSQVDRLYAQLQADYGYRPAIDPLAAFSQGAPALTPEAASLALRNARSAAARLISEISSLEALLADRENLSASEFEKSRFEKLEKIEAVAGEIRGDVYVDILEKLEGKTGEAVIEESLPGLQLRRLAEEIERGIVAYESSQGVQTVSIQDLRRPSLNALARAVGRLTLDLPADRDAAFQVATQR